MNLYLVYCAHVDTFEQTETYPVFVVANSPSDAGNYAMEAMKTLGYKYTRFIERVDLVASTNCDEAKRLLVYPIVEGPETIN